MPPRVSTPKSTAGADFLSYSGENILLVGGAGFIGSHLAEHLSCLGANLVILDNLSTGTRENIASVPHELITASAEDADLVGILRSYEIGRVFHLACGSLSNSLRDPQSDFTANIVCAFKCLEAFRNFGSGKSFVYCSTGSVYGEPLSEGYSEDTPFCPTTPYGTSKACADLYAQLYCRFFGLPIRIVRYNNIYGPRKRGTAIPTFIEKALKHETITIEGGQQIRTPTFVLDAVEATLLAGISERAIGVPINVSSDESVSVLEMAEMIWRLVNGEGAVPQIQRVDYRPGEIMRLVPSTERAMATIGWRAKHRFEEGLRALIEYIKDELKSE